MIKTVRKIRIKSVILMVAFIGAVLVLKSPYMNSLYEGDYILFMKQILFMQGEDLIANVFWLFPIVGSLFFISDYGYSRLIHFSTRYKNRRNYIRKVYFRTLGYALLFHFLFSVLQILIFSGSYGIQISFSLMNVILQYVIENTFLSLLVICISLVIKKYIYAYISVITGLIILLRVPKLYGKWIPFISLNCTNSINVFTIIGCIVITFIVYKLYLHCDIGGNYEN